MDNLPSQPDLKLLKKQERSFCLSVYMPLIGEADTSNPNRIELKNMLREAETLLKTTSMSSLDIRKTLLPLRRILDSSEFWPPRHELGLALFSHPQFFRGFHLPNEFIEHKLSASTHFDLEPLKRFINSDKQYYVLTLSHKHIQLFQGGRNELKPVKLKGLPTNLWSALNIDEFPNWRETHTIAPASFGKGSEAYHGQYNVKETDKVMLLDFFRRIDKRLRRFLRRKTRPLILGGVDYLIPIYRKANTYPYLLDKTISGNLDEAGPVEIQRSAWTLIEKGETP